MNRKQNKKWLSENKKKYNSAINGNMSNNDD